MILLLSSIILVGCQAKTSTLPDNNTMSTESESPNQGDVTPVPTNNGEEDPEDVISTDDSNADSKSLLATQRNYIREKKNPVELKSWMDANMDVLSKEDATVMIANLEEYLDKSRRNYEKLLSKK